VVRALPMEPLKVTPIERQYGTAQEMCAGEDVWVRSRRASVLLRCQDIVAKLPQALNHGKSEILVGVELHA